MCESDNDKYTRDVSEKPFVPEKSEFSVPDNDAVIHRKKCSNMISLPLVQRRCVGDGDHNRSQHELIDIPKREFRRCETLTIYFRQIYELVRKLENSLAISRQIENHEFMHIVMLNGENKHLRAEIEQLQQKLQMKRLLEEKLGLEQNQRDEIFRDHDDSFKTMSIVNLQYKYNELWSGHQNILKTLANRDEELKMLNKKLDGLQNHSQELKEIILQKDVTIHELCMKYMKLKNRRDILEKTLKGEIKSLNKSLERSDRMLTKHFALTESKIKQLLMNTTNSKDALLLQEVS